MKHIKQIMAMAFKTLAAKFVAEFVITLWGKFKFWIWELME